MSRDSDFEATVFYGSVAILRDVSTQSDGSIEVDGIVQTDKLSSLTIDAPINIDSSVVFNHATTFNDTISIPNPLNASDAVSKYYCDTIFQTSSNKESANVASTGSNILLSNLIPGYVLDDVTLITGHRVLLKDQTNMVENGIYVINSSGAATRSHDMPIGSNAAGDFLFIIRGSTNALSGWIVSAFASEAIIGTHQISFVEISGAGGSSGIVPGYGLIQNGLTLNVSVDNSSIEIIENQIRIKSTALGSGLNGGSGIPISIDPSQPTITSIGILTGLTSSGIVYITDTSNATALDTGALQVSGGISSDGNIFTSGNVISSTAPSIGHHLTNKIYVDSLAYLSTGFGLTLLSGVISINSSQPTITSIGILTGLTSSGIVYITDTSNATALDTGALQVSGGISSDGNIFTSGNVISSTAPSTGHHLANKTYVDSLVYLTPGTGLSISGSTISINSSQPTITSIGTLIGLTSSGIIYITDTSNATSLDTGALQVSGGISSDGNIFTSGNVISSTAPTTGSHLANKTYVDSLVYLTPGTGLSLSGSTISINSSQPTITSLGTLTGLTSSSIIYITDTSNATSLDTGALQVSGGISSDGNIFTSGNVISSTAPSTGHHLANKTYVDSLVYLTPGTGLSLSGSTISINSSQPTITSLGTLTGLTSSGMLIVTNTEESTSVTTGSIITRGGLGITKDLYVGGDIFIGGNVEYTGGSTVSGPMIVTDTSESTGIGTGALQVNGGISSKGNIFASGNMIASTTPTIGSHLANKTYVDSLAYLIVGSGLILSGGMLSLATSQSNITSVGTLTGVTSSGIVNVTDTTDSTSLSSGSIVTSGGMSIAKSTLVGGLLVISDTTESTSIDTGCLQVSGGIGIKKSVYLGGTLNIPYNLRIAANQGVSFKSFILSNSDVANPETRFNVTNTGIISNYISRFRLFSLGNPTALNMEYLEITAASTGSTIDWKQSGTGISRSLFIGGNLSLNGWEGSKLLGNTFTDSITTPGGTLTRWNQLMIDRGTLTSVNAVTTTEANSLYISGSPIAGANQTIVNSYSLHVGSGTTFLNGLVRISGTMQSDTISSYSITAPINVNSEIRLNNPLVLVKSTVEPLVPTSGVLMYSEPINGRLNIKNPVGRKDVLSDSLLNPAELITYSTDVNASKVFPGPQTDGQVLTADGLSTYGISWMGFSYYDPELDTQKGKFTSLVALEDQTIPTTETVVRMATEYWVDRGVYEIGVSGETVFIKKPGIYFLHVKLTAFNSKYIGTSTVKWVLYQRLGNQADYTASAVSPSYTTHASGTGHASSTIIMITQVPNEGMYVRTTMRQTSGTSTLKTYGTGCYFTVTTVPFQYYFQGTGSSTWTTLSNAYTTIPITSISYNGKSGFPTTIFYLHSVSNGFMTTSTDIYLISVKLVVQKTSGTDLTSCSMRLVDENDVPFPGVLNGTPYMISPAVLDDETCAITLLWQGNLSLVANVTQVKCQVMIDTGTNCRATLKEFIVYGVNIAQYPDLIEFRGFSNPGTVLDTTWRDVPLNSAPITDNGVTYVTNSPEITLHNTGYYFICGVIQIDNPNNIGGRQIHGRIAIWQKGEWITLPGSYNIGMSGRKRGNTIIVHAQLQLGARIKLQLKTDGTTTDNITNGSCSLAVSAPEHVINTVNTFITFGTYYMWIMSLDKMPMLFDWGERLRLSTKFIPSGIYVLELSGTVEIVDYRMDGFLRFTQINPDGTYRTLFTQTCTVPRRGDYIIFRKMNIAFQKGITHLLLEQSTSQLGTEMYATNFLINMYRVM